MSSLQKNSISYSNVNVQEGVLSICKAQVSDASEIKDLVSSLSNFYLEEKNSSLPLWFSKTLEVSEFERRLSSDEFTNFVYLDNNAIIGYISIKSKSHLYHLFVDEKYQGRGVSKKLWNYVMSNLGSNHYTVRSSVYAVPVYKKFGFRESGPLESKDGISFQVMNLIR